MFHYVIVRKEIPTPFASYGALVLKDNSRLFSSGRLHRKEIITKISPKMFFFF